MKKICIVIFFCICIALVGCERNPLSVNFTNISTTSADKSSILVSFANDKQYSNLSYDVMIMSNISNAKIKVAKEYDDYLEITIPSKDLWYSLETLSCIAENNIGKENFENYEKAANQIYLFETDEQYKIYLKVVAGEKIENIVKTGYILENKINISKAFSFETKIKK